jgi:hypothetical protein
MRIISFAWTTDALLAGIKTCTRRDWNMRYAESFKKGEQVQAWDKLPRAGGKRVGTIELTETPDYSSQYPEEDYLNEGLKWMALEGRLINGMQPIDFWNRWRDEAKSLWVIRFKLTEIA